MNSFNNENLLKLILTNFKPYINKKLYFNINNKLFYKIIGSIYNFDKFYQSLGSSKVVIDKYSYPFNTLTLISENKIAATYFKSEFRIWDLETLECINKLEGHCGQVSSVLLLNNKHIVSCASDILKVWDCLNNFKCILTKKYEGLDWLDTLLLLQNGRIACSSFGDICSIAIINPEQNFNLEKVLSEHTNTITNIANLYDSLIASASCDMSVKIWDTETYLCKKTLVGHNSGIRCLLYINKDKLIITGLNKVLQVWDIKNLDAYCPCVKTINVHTMVNCLLLLPFGYFAFDCRDRIEIWNLKKFEEVKSLQGHKDNIFSMLVLSDDRLISTSVDKTIMIWGY
jgi:WD40 repeat protein